MLRALLVSLSLLVARSVAAPTYISASDPLLVRWSGRPSLPEADGAILFDWASTAASVAVQGVGSSLTLHANLSAALGPARVSVYVNGYEAAVLMLSADASSYLLAAAMPNAVNSVDVRYDFEPVYSHADASRALGPRFVAFSTGSNGSFVPPALVTRRMDIVGDSISAGSMFDKLQAVNGPLSLNDGCHPWSPPTGMSDATTWHGYLCRALQANCTAIAWSGKGLIHNGGCNAGPVMPQLYAQNFGTGPQPWDFSRASRPDAVLIYLCVHRAVTRRRTAARAALSARG